MKQGMLAALFFAVLAFGFGMTQAPSDASADTEQVSPELVEPGVALDADELQGGSCGDGQCQPPEDCNTCPQDCGQCCGNRRCEPPEDLRVRLRTSRCSFSSTMRIGRPTRRTASLRSARRSEAVISAS